MDLAGDKRATAIVKELNRVRSGRQITWGLIPRWSLGRLPCYDWVSGGIWPCSEVVVETHIGKSTSRLVHPRVYSPGKVGATESIHSRLLPPSWFFAPQAFMALMSEPLCTVGACSLPLVYGLGTSYALEHAGRD